MNSCIWLLKILLPDSLATALLDYSGWLHRWDFLLEPAMGAMSLPPAAALPILIGLTAGVYGCLAAMAVLTLSAEHMTLITVFVLIAHSLPQEGIIQAKSGINFVKTTLVRLAAARLQPSSRHGGITHQNQGPLAENVFKIDLEVIHSPGATLPLNRVSAGAVGNFPPLRPFPPSGGPENLRFQTVSKWFFTDLVVMNQPLDGSRRGQQR